MMKKIVFLIILIFLVSSVKAYSNLSYGAGCYGVSVCYNDSAEEESVQNSGGGTHGGSATRIIANPAQVKKTCLPKWECTEWSECTIGNRLRTCFNLNPECLQDKPLEIVSCTLKEALFDVSVDLLKNDLDDEDNLTFIVGLINVGNNESVNAELYYQIYDFNDSLVLDSTENRTVDVQLEFIKDINIAALSNGEYELVVNLYYSGQRDPAKSIDVFSVSKQRKAKTYPWFLLLLIFTIITSFFVLFYDFHRKFFIKSNKKNKIA